MTLPLLVRRSLRQHALSTLVTACSIALASGLLMSVWVIKEQARENFTAVTGGFDAVLGARGSKLQLVLNSIFHLEESPGNIPVSDYQQIRKHPSVALAVPLAVGDNYLGYRLVGTTTNLFGTVEYLPGRRYQVQAGGRVFQDGYREAVIGDFVARRLGLGVGDQFQPYHGLNFDPRSQHAETYLITGVLEPSGTPADRVFWIPVAGIQNMKGHNPDTASDLSAVLVKLKSPMAGQQLSMTYNKQGNRLTFAWPIATVVAQLFEKISWMDRVLALVAYLVALVAGASILASIYNSMNERRRDIAILRALGAHRRTVFGAVVLEASAIAGIGAVAGFLLYGVILGAAASIIRARTGVVLHPWEGHWVMLWSPCLMVALGALAGLLPAFKAYKTPVSEHLSPIS